MYCDTNEVDSSFTMFWYRQSTRVCESERSTIAATTYINQAHMYVAKDDIMADLFFSDKEL